MTWGHRMTLSPPPDRAAHPSAGAPAGVRTALAGGLPPVLGWLVGAGLLASSPLWSPRQKVLGLLAFLSLIVGPPHAIRLPAGGWRDRVSARAPPRRPLA
jgi:hypothetical protein